MWENDDLTAKIKVELITDIGEQNMSSNIFKINIFNELKHEQNKIVTSQIESIIEFAKNENVDIFNFSEDLYRKDKIKWQREKENWNKIFPQIKYEVIIESNIRNSFEIKQPVGSEEE